MKGTNTQKQPEIKMKAENAVRPYQRQQYIACDTAPVVFQINGVAPAIYSKVV
jgi:hypothetical protein